MITDPITHRLSVSYLRHVYTFPHSEWFIIFSQAVSFQWWMLIADINFIYILTAYQCDADTFLKAVHSTLIRQVIWTVGQCYKQIFYVERKVLK